MSYSTYDPSGLVEDSETIRTQSKAKAPTKVTINEANRASAIVAKYPTISAGSLVGAVKLNINDNDPRLKQIVLQETITREEGSWGALKSAGKGAIRETFVGFQNLWEMAAPRGVRYLEGRQQGMDHAEARDLSSASFYDIREQARESGRGEDLGTGWVIGGTDPTTTPEYKNLLAAGVDPAEAREFVLDNILGVNIYEEQRKKAETAIQFTGERAEKFRAAGLDPTVTIGRWLFKPIDEVIEPGTDMYNNLTGTLDIIAQIFLDPVGMAALGISKIRKLGKGLAGIKDVDQLSGIAKLFEETGMLQGARKSVFGPTLREFLAGEKGLAFKKYLWGTETSEIIAASGDKIQSLNFYDALREFKKVHKGKSFDEIDEIFTADILNDKLFNEIAISSGKTGKVNLIHAAYGGQVPTIPKFKNKGNRLTEIMERTYGPRLNVGNKDGSLVPLNRFFRIALLSGKPADKAGQIKKLNKYMDEAMDALKEPDDATAVANILGTFMKKELRGPVEIELLKVAKSQGNDFLSPFQQKILDEGTNVWAKFIDSGTEVKKSLNSSYGIGTSGDKIPLTSLLKKIMGKRNKLDEAFELVDPLTAQQLADEIFLPNPNDLARAAKLLDGKLGLIGNKLLASESKATLTRVMDSYYSNIFKPLVLLRPAWTVRVIAEEQIRMLSSGVTTVISSPIELIARLINVPRNATSSLMGSWLDNAKYLDGNNMGSTDSIRRGWGGTGEYATVSRQENKRAWNIAVFRNFMNHKFDPLSRRLAAAQLKPTASARTREINKIIKDAKTYGHELNNHVRKVTGAEGHAFNRAGFKSKDGDALTEEFVHYVNAGVAQVTGGVVEFGTKRVAAADALAKTGEAKMVPRKANQFIDENGKKDLLEDLLNEDLTKAELAGLEKIDMKKYNAGDLEPEEYDRISTVLARNLKEPG